MIEKIEQNHALKLKYPKDRHSSSKVAMFEINQIKVSGKKDQKLDKLGD